MKNVKNARISQHKQAPGSLVSYIAGFVLSVLLTLAAYVTVVNSALPEPTIVVTIVGLAVAQLLVQLVFFLHMGREARPRWNLITMLFMLLVLVIIVFGSLWIMNNLNYNMMTPEQTDEYIMKEEGINRE